MKLPDFYSIIEIIDKNAVMDRTFYLGVEVDHIINNKCNFY